MADILKITLEVDDKGSFVVKKFSKGVENKVKEMSNKSIGYLKKMHDRFKKIGGTAAKLTKKIGGITAKITALGAAAITAFAGFTLKKSLEEFAKFETALVDVAKVSKEPLESVKRKIMDMDPALGSATQMVKGYYQTMSAGVTEPKAALETLTQGAQMAKAAHIEQGTAIEALTKLMAGFHGKIQNVSDAADLLFTIEKEGVTTVAQLSTVVGGLAAMSDDLNVSQNELGGALALITQTAGSTSEAATQYQAVLTGLMKPTEEMKTAINKMGYESAQAAIKQEGLAGVLKNLKDYTGGSAEKMNELFGRVEAVKGMAALSANDFETLTGKVEAMQQKTGAAADAWEKYKETLAAIWETFKNTVGKQLIMIGEMLAPAIKSVVESLSKWLEKNRELIAQEVGSWLEKIVKFARELKPLFISIVEKIWKWYTTNKDMMQSKFVDYLKNMVKGIGVLVDNINIAIIPIKGLGIAFNAVGTAIAWIASKIVDAYNGIKNFIDTVKQNSVVKFILDFIGKGSTEKPLTEKMTEVEEKFKILTENIEALKPSFDVNFEQVSSKITGIETQLQNLEEVKPQIELNIDPALNQLQTLNSALRSTALSAAQMEKERAAVLGAMESVDHYRYSEVKRWWDSQIAEQKRIESQINKDFAIQQKYSAKYSDYSTKAGSGGRKYWYEREYQHGTGPSGLPYTGIFYGHKGEIVKSPSESRRERAGSNKSANTGDIHIYIPASAAPQRPEDWRYIVREIIKPELDKVT